MRLGRLVAAGLVAGAAAGFLGALLRPRPVHPYGADHDRPATGFRGDLTAAVSLPESALLGEPAFATSAAAGGLPDASARRVDVDAATPGAVFAARSARADG